MLAPATTAALFATTASCTAEVVSLRTVRAGELGKFDLVIWKVQGQRNRFFLTVDGKLKANTWLDQVMVNPTAEEAEYYFGREYTNTILAVEEAAQNIIGWAAKLQAIANERKVNPAKAAIRDRNRFGAVGPVTKLALEYFERTWGFTATEAVAA